MKGADEARRPWLVGTAVLVLVFAVGAMIAWTRVPAELARHRLDVAALQALPNTRDGDILLQRHLGSMIEGGDGSWRTLSGPKRSVAAILAFDLQWRHMGVYRYAMSEDALALQLPTLDEVAEAYRVCGAESLAQRLDQVAEMQRSGQLQAGNTALDQQLAEDVNAACTTVHEYIASNASAIAD
ncbi:MAG: hypothetical protein PF961_15490 [Planctomycetota bacterium]|jgi:hypothetical protein|nr:hypothetical protein [Planctomycetota bacterium]